MTAHVPELGQAIFGCPSAEFAVPDYANALMLHVLDEIDRVYWNNHQEHWERHDDPKIPGLTFRPYWWGNEEAPEADLPNLVVDGFDLEIRWYKHAGRSTSCNRELTPAEWVEWFDCAMGTVRKAERE